MKRNPVLLCAFHAGMMSLFPMAVLALFYEQHIGMSMSDIFLVQGFFGLVLALFEFPSGYVADRIGYRTSLLLGAVFGAVGWSAYAMAHSIVGVVVAEVILGVALSLISGTNRALLYESLIATDDEASFSLWEGRLQFWGQASEGTCALTAGLLYVISPSLPFWVTAGVYVVMVVLALNMVEPDRSHHLTVGNHFAHAWSMVRFALKETPELRAVFALNIALGLVSFIPVWIVPIYATDAGVPEAWLGPIWSVANYTVAIFSLLSPRFEARWGAIHVLWACVLLIPVGYLGLGLTHAWWGFVFYFVLTLLRGLRNPIMAHLENRLIPSADRAGFLSMRSLLFRMSFLLLAPIVGAGIDAYGQHSVFLVVGACLFALSALALVIYARHARQRLVAE